RVPPSLPGGPPGRPGGAPGRGARGMVGRGLVVDAGGGRPWNPDRFSAAWPEFLSHRGLPHVRFHDLRHAHATFMLMQGVHPKVVSERLGHASIGITLDTYSHVLPTMQEQAARGLRRTVPDR